MSQSLVMGIFFVAILAGLAGYWHFSGRWVSLPKGETQEALIMDEGAGAHPNTELYE